MDLRISPHTAAMIAVIGLVIALAAAVLSLTASSMLGVVMLPAAFVASVGAGLYMRLPR